MNLKSIIKRIIGRSKKEEQLHIGLSGDLENFEYEKYEIRKNEVTEGIGQINGIFYILDGAIIPDFFSEYVASDKEKAFFRKKEQFHTKFYNNYIRRKYPNLPSDDKYLPCGRVDTFANVTTIYIDSCYADDEDIINEIHRLYRIDGGTIIVSPNYRCYRCGADH